jgi:hypothetical protein
VSTITVKPIINGVWVNGRQCLVGGIRYELHQYPGESSWFAGQTTEATGDNRSGSYAKDTRVEAMRAAQFPEEVIRAMEETYA